MSFKKRNGIVILNLSLDIEIGQDRPVSLVDKNREHLKLSDYAKQQGVRYETAWRWFRDGKIQGRRVAS